MPHDAQGREIRPGDVVEVVADGLPVPTGSRWRVQEVFPDREVCNLRVTPELADGPEAEATELCAGNVRRVVP